MSFLKVIAVIALLIFSSPKASFSDYGEAFLYIGCNHEENTFEVNPLVIWNDDLDRIVKTVDRGYGVIDNKDYKLIRMYGRNNFETSCSFKDLTIKVNLSSDEPYLKLYINNNFLTKYHIFTIQNWVHSYPFRYKDGSWEEFNTNGWTFINIGGNEKDWRDISSVEDPFKVLSKFEYTDDPMLFKELVSTGGVCSHSLEIVNQLFINRVPDIIASGSVGNGKFITPNGDPYEVMENPALFDFDNDGVEDQVFMYSNAGSYLNGDLLYVAYGERESSKRKEKLFIDDIHIFPCQFDPTVDSSTSCPTVGSKANEAGIKIFFKDNAKSIFFRGRYTDVGSFRYEDKTYLLLRSRFLENGYYAAVIYPHDKTKYDSKCLFKRMP